MNLCSNCKHLMDLYFDEQGDADKYSCVNPVFARTNIITGGIDRIWNCKRLRLGTPNVINDDISGACCPDGRYYEANTFIHQPETPIT